MDEFCRKRDEGILKSSAMVQFLPYPGKAPVTYRLDYTLFQNSSFTRLISTTAVNWL